MVTHHTHHCRVILNQLFNTKSLILSTALMMGSTSFLAAVESIPSAPVDQVPQNIRTQLEREAGGATISEIKVDRSFGDPRYVARYRDPASKEMHTVTLGQMGNVIESGAIPVDGAGAADSGVIGDKPEPSKTVPMDGPVPVTPPKRPIAPANADTPAVANMNKDQQTDPKNKTASQENPAPQKPEAAIPRRTPPVAPDTKSKPVDLPQKDEDRDSTKTPVETPKKSIPSAPLNKKSTDQKNP